MANYHPRIFRFTDQAEYTVSIPLLSSHPPLQTCRKHNTLLSEMQPARILSIQSHVVNGAVGNKCVVFPLNRLGHEVDAINSVQFSNHTGYPTFCGQVMDGEQLWDIVQGLDNNGLLSGYTHLLTGYIASVSLLKTVVKVYEKLRQYNPNLIYGKYFVYYYCWLC